jgi:hypothetical protein
VPDIELSSLIQKGFIDIRLNNEGFGISVLMLFFVSDYFFYLVQSQTNIYAVAPVCELARFHDPNVFGAIFLW